jgi:hypothetical protein
MFIIKYELPAYQQQSLRQDFTQLGQKKGNDAKKIAAAF